jgi:hypothetical protein
MYHQKTGEYIPKSKRPAHNRSMLFDMQTVLIEHKFPANYIAVHEYQISNAGDIFRSMTGGTPDPGYINQKIESLFKYLKDNNLGDFRDYQELMKEPFYKEQREKYMKNLEELERLTKKAHIDLKRKEVMLRALELTRKIILWFESGRPHRPPTEAMKKLLESLDRYYPTIQWSLDYPIA